MIDVTKMDVKIGRGCEEKVFGEKIIKGKEKEAIRRKGELKKNGRLGCVWVGKKKGRIRRRRR